MGDETDFETCIETSATARAERLDVIETAGRKRRWTPEARARIIAESLERMCRRWRADMGCFRSSCTHGGVDCGSGRRP